MSNPQPSTYHRSSPRGRSCTSYFRTPVCDDVYISCCVICNIQIGNSYFCVQFNDISTCSGARPQAELSVVSKPVLRSVRHLIRVPQLVPERFARGVCWGVNCSVNIYSNCLHQIYVIGKRNEAIRYFYCVRSRSSVRDVHGCPCECVCERARQFECRCALINHVVRRAGGKSCW